MFSIRTVIFLSCAAMAMAHPFFVMGRERKEFVMEPLMAGQEPLRAGQEPLNQVASPSYDYGAGGGDAGTGGTTETASESNEVNADPAGSVVATDNDADENDEMEAAEQAGANAAENDSPDAVETAGGASGAASPNTLDGGSKLAKKGEKSSAGQNAGIAVGVIGVVGLAAGIGFFIYRKRRAAAYGSRF